MLKKKIIKELKQLLIKNKKFITDIWLYGSIDDQISDIDLIFLYKKKPKKIKLSQFLKQKIDNGTVIYIPSDQSKNIFLFEELNIFSIKFKKKINEKIATNLKPLRYLTSFLERYYERRFILKKINNINPRTLRLVKSIIFSYQNFLNFCRNRGIKLKYKLFNFREYRIVRKRYLSNKFNYNYLKKYLSKFKHQDKVFYTQSVTILNKYYKFNQCYYLNYKFNKYSRYSLKKNKDYMIVPKILAYIYKIYSSENIPLSKKINHDFNSNIKIDHNSNIFNEYLKKKVRFLNAAYIDLKKHKFKSGLYRFNWYLTY